MNKTLSIILALASSLLVLYWVRNNLERAWEINIGIYGMVMYLFLREGNNDKR